MITDEPKQSVYNNVTKSKPKPEDYLNFSIFNTIFCCFCLGIPALIYSVKSREAAKYEPDDAAIYSKKAKLYNILAFIFGLIINSIFIYSSRYILKPFP